MVNRAGGCILLAALAAAGWSGGRRLTTKRVDVLDVRD